VEPVPLGKVAPVDQHTVPCCPCASHLAELEARVAALTQALALAVLAAGLPPGELLPS
jgi:hypothetical protein